ncbi:MAG: glutaredoxin family protein [Cellvibrionaceae bacterium]
MKTLVLYSTLGCHLCEQAKALMWPIMTAAGYALEEVDIADSEELLARYRISIPVAKNPDSGEELFWPFDDEQVRNLLE